MSIEPEFEKKIMWLISRGMSRKQRKRGMAPETRLREDLGMDSLALAALVFRLEDAFEVNLDDAVADIDLGQLHTVQDIVAAAWEIVGKARARGE